MVILHQLYHTKIIPISMLGYKFFPLVIIKIHQIFTSSYYLERLWIITQEVTMIKLTACIFNNKYNILRATYFETTLKWLKYKEMSTVSYIIFKCEKYQVLSYIWILKRDLKNQTRYLLFNLFSNMNKLLICHVIISHNLRGPSESHCHSIPDSILTIKSSLHT